MCIRDSKKVNHLFKDYPYSFNHIIFLNKDLMEEFRMKKARIPFLSIGLIVMAVIIVNMVLNQNKEVVPVSYTHL